MESRYVYIICGTVTAFMVLLCGHTICNAERHFGEYILYVLTALCVVSFLGSVFQSESMKLCKAIAVVQRVTGTLLIYFAVGLVLLLIACRTDNVTYTEKYAIVLGAPVREDGASVILEKRVETAADYLNKNKDAVAVLTGGNSPFEGGDEFVEKVTTEGAYMSLSLIHEGIDPNRLYLEDKATTTVENFQYSTELLGEAGYRDGDTVVIITNRFHAYRVRRLAEEAGGKNLRILAAPILHAGAVSWYLREIPVSTVFFITHELFRWSRQ